MAITAETRQDIWSWSLQQIMLGHHAAVRTVALSAEFLLDIANTLQTPLLSKRPIQLSKLQFVRISEQFVPEAAQLLRLKAWR